MHPHHLPRWFKGGWTMSSPPFLFAQAVSIDDRNVAGLALSSAAYSGFGVRGRVRPLVRLDLLLYFLTHLLCSDSRGAAGIELEVCVDVVQQRRIVLLPEVNVGEQAVNNRRIRSKRACLQSRFLRVFNPVLVQKRATEFVMA